MEQQIESKDVNATQVEEKIQKDIADQEVAVKEKTAIYLSQTERKKEEEKELLKILKDYRQKFTEFDKANRKTREYYKNFEKEIRALDQKKKDLERQKEVFEQKSSSKKSGKKAQASNELQHEEINKLQKDWEDQKAAILADQSSLKEQCALLQEQIKAKQKAKQ